MVVSSTSNLPLASRLASDSLRLQMSSAPIPFTAHRILSPVVTLRTAHGLLSNPNNAIRLFGWNLSVSRVSVGLQQKSRVPTALKSQKNDHEDILAGQFHECSTDPNGLGKESGKETAKGFSSKELMESLKTYGVAGVLSYGLLNTIYYLTMFLLVWFYFAPAPGRMGYAAAVERFLKLMAMVWAGSQVTKIVRAGGALALAPFVDKGLSWFTVKFNFESKGKSFAAIAGMCFGLALLLFVGLTLLWA